MGNKSSARSVLDAAGAESGVAAATVDHNVFLGADNDPIGSLGNVQFGADSKAVDYQSFSSTGVPVFFSNISGK